MNDSVVGSAGVDRDSQRVKHVERVAFGEIFPSEKQRRRRRLVGQKTRRFGEHRTVEEVQIPLLRFLTVKKWKRRNQMDVRRDAIVVERHVKNGFGRRQRVEKRGNVRVERFRGRERAQLRVTQK